MQDLSLQKELTEVLTSVATMEVNAENWSVAVGIMQARARYMLDRTSSVNRLPMRSKKDAALAIEQVRMERGMSKTRLSERSTVDPHKIAHMTNVFSGRYKGKGYNIDTFFKIVDALGVEIVFQDKSEGSTSS